MSVPRILVGIPLHSPHPNFLRDAGDLISQAGAKYQMSEIRTIGVPLVEAQNRFADFMLEGRFDYLLTLEDDHWGHTVYMLDSLVRANKDICAINYYSRHGALLSTAMDRDIDRGDDYFTSSQNSSGVHEIDLCGFGFTLIKREVIETLDKPTFRLNDPSSSSFATDKNFCERSKRAGFGVWACFDHNLSHRGIDKSNIIKHRKKVVDSLNPYRRHVGKFSPKNQ